MEKVVNKMAKFLASPISKAVGGIVLVIGTMLFTSFTTSKSVTDGLKDYYTFQSKQAIREVLNEEVIPQLKTQGEAIARLEKTTDALVCGTYDGYVKDINKYYEKYQKGDSADFTKTNFDAMSGWWKKLPEDRKTDALRMKYEMLMAYYPNLK
jgi:hypothetical protein